ncbi:DUF4870 domain-containing protein [Chitinophaga flava]|uniref:Import component protein n=1 Tax=Chitinophaga flava TaxID=2259036 RepID=A0A365XQ67_9BACT|nr:DUF4870 domain-containing protein [Chitinophaga flava]RBL88492.1 import component protein [Chitinophaga flava]
MKTKQWAIIAYITIIGWIIAFVKSKENKDTLVTYHLEQALGLAITSLLWSVVVGVMLSIIPALYTPLSILSILPLIFMIFGIINANSGVQKPIPVIGKFFENKFVFLQQ